MALYPAWIISRPVSGDWQLVKVLTEFLVRVPERRECLNDRASIDRLLEDLREKRIVPPPYVDGGFRSSVEIHTAVRHSKYVHQFHGRPRPDDELGDIDEAVDLIAESLRSSPYNERALM